MQTLSPSLVWLVAAKVRRSNISPKRAFRKFTLAASSTKQWKKLALNRLGTISKNSARKSAVGEGKDFVVKRVVKSAHDLIDAGQKLIVLDGLYTWSEYKILKHEFPGQMSVIAVVTPKHLRYQRMAKRPERPMQPREVDQRDWSEIENLEKGGPIAIADYFVMNDRGLDELYAQLEVVTHHEHFCKAPEQC